MVPREVTTHLHLEGGAFPPIAITAAVFVEDLRYADPKPSMLVRPGKRPLLIKVAALGHPYRIKQHLEPVRRPEALHKDRLLPVREHPRVGASVFSQKLHRPFQDRAPELQSVDIAPQGLGVLLELFDGSRIRLSRHLAGRLLVQRSPLPIVEGGPLGTEPI